ncbi:MAG: hypothetical protein KUG72_10525 [Pseudomonadales bacterium]|nr:hypothetical protein [Pseudomonadales bacterium]
MKISKTTRIIVGVISFFCALIFLLWASDAPNEWYINYLPAAFCFLVVGACFLPKIARGFCGDVISICIIILAVWYLAKSLPSPEPADNPLKFAFLYGGISVTYLIGRYKHVFSKKST